MSIDHHPRAPRRESARSTTGARRPRVAGALGSVLLASALLAACGTPTVEPAPAVTVTPSIEPSKQAPPTPEVPVTWPLTGVATDELVDRPAVSVKVENTSSARPQSGLEQADVVWETIVEFEVSRLVAVYQSQVPTEVGPVRSVRPMDIPIAASLHGPLVFSGGQAGILALVPAAGIQAISHDAGAAGLARVSWRSAPHNVYGNVETFMASADSTHSSAPPEQFVFARSLETSGAVLSGTPATTISFRLSAQSSPSWTWDEGSSLWLRSEGSTPAMANSGARLSATNVVAVTAPHPDSGFDAQQGAPVPTYSLVGEGPVTVATGGRTVEGTWRKSATDEPLQLFDADGSPLLLAPGATWVELVPQGTGSFTVG
ncbi:DUF3048 domain-containing protein [Actinotalea sp.]|uniref:DUF3048 domain-containing protein n=1 Tax=Actinotalea sp. TaxID=1872145 RepID=UPI0035643BE2